MLIQAGAEAVDEGDGADVQGRLVHTQSSGAESLQALRDEPSERCAAAPIFAPLGVQLYQGVLPNRQLMR